MPDRYILARNGGLMRDNRSGGRERILSLELEWNLQHATVIVLPMVRVGEPTP